MANVKLVYFEGCPNAIKVRRSIEETGTAFVAIRQDDLSAGDPLREFSSPTILKDNEVIFGTKTGAGGGGCSLQVPTTDEIRRKLGKVGPTASRYRSMAGFLAQLESAASAVMVGLCPVRIPAIAAFLASIGLGLLAQESVLQPFLIVLLPINLGGLTWSAFKEHQRKGPLVLWALAAAGLYMSRYVYVGAEVNSALMYVSIASILGASLWNLWLRKRRPACPPCVEGQASSGRRSQA